MFIDDDEVLILHYFVPSRSQAVPSVSVLPSPVSMLYPISHRISLFSAKERGGFSSGFEDDSKFDNPWRRDGPLPDIATSRDTTRRRFDGPSTDRTLPSVSEGPNDWRASTRPARPVDPEGPSFKRKGAGFVTPEQAGAADKEEVWTIGSRFKPHSGPSDDTTGKFGSVRGKSDMGPPKDIVDEGDWRNASRPKAAGIGSISREFLSVPVPS